MKRLFIFALIGFAVISAQAQRYDKDIQLNPPRPKVGVVLGGGGAKGASHIGVLKYIEEMGIPVDYVAGTSMGSIIGGLYAMGYSPDELTQLISKIDWSAYIGNKIDRTVMSEELRQRNSTTVINIPFGLKNLFGKDSKSSIIEQLPSAFVNNSSLINLFNDLCVGYQEDMDFNDLPIPFACVATDLVTGNEVVLRSGSIPTAMRASMAIPGVFAPVPMGDKILIDGGLVNNFPADVLREMGADIIIGVEVTPNKQITPEELQSLPQLLGRLVTNSTSSKRKENRELCNIRIVPDISGFGMLSFTPEAIDTLVGRGYKMASRYHDQFQAIKDALDKKSSKPVKKELHAPKAKNLATDSILLASIEINGVPDRQSRWLIRKGRLKPGMKVVDSEIERAVDIYRGTGCFDKITYNVKESDSLHRSDASSLSESYDLTMNLEPAYPHVLGVGVRYDTEEGAGLLINIGLNEKKFNGSKFSLSTKLSYSPKVNLTYTYSLSGLANFNLAYDFRNEHFKTPTLYVLDKTMINLNYRQHKWSAYISQFHLLNLSTTVGVSYINTSFDKTSMDEEFFDDWFEPNKFITPFVNLKFDNLDDAYFAKHGLFASVKSHFYWDPKNRENNNFDVGYAFQYYITPKNGRLTIIPQLYGRYLFETTFFYNLRNKYGGEIEGRHFENQLPFIGINYLDVLGPEPFFLNVVRCDVRYNFYGKHYLTAMYNGMYYFTYTQGVGLKYSFDSPVGPISLTAQWSNLYVSQFSLYFSFGYTF